jgi:hypothetical protein
MRKNKLKDLVETMLVGIPETRNCDIRLTIEIWKRFYPDRIRKTLTGGGGIYLDDLYDLPREDNIKRYRARFQNDENKYLPTDWKVAKRRKINEGVWREALGYPIN